MTKGRAATIGLIGLGAMGSGMAANIARAGHPLVVYDIDPSRSALLEALGASRADGPADVATRARVVVTMVDTTAQSRDVITGPGGIADGARAGDAVACMSTIDPVAVKEMAATLAAMGVGMIDAPVSGMIKGATEGTLKAFVGGDEATLDICRPALAAMTGEIVHVGSLGQGLVMKLINNMLYKINSVAAIEGMVLAVKAGLDPAVVRDVIGRSTGGSPAFAYRARRMVDRDFDGVRLDISYKVLELETSLGRSFGVPLFMSNIAMQVYEMGRASGLGSRDATALVTIYEGLTGVRVGGSPEEDVPVGIAD